MSLQLCDYTPILSYFQNVNILPNVKGKMIRIYNQTFQGISFVSLEHSKKNTVFSHLASFQPIKNITAVRFMYPHTKARRKGILVILNNLNQCSQAE